MTSGISPHLYRASVLLMRGRRAALNPRSGERCFAPAPLEEPHADLLLKGSYLKAQGRLVEMNQFRGSTEVQCLCDGEKGSNLTKFH
jgi:hypothetical protein